MYKYIRYINIHVDISNDGFHRKAGFHWTKKGLTCHCVERKLWKTIDNWRRGCFAFGIVPAGLPRQI